MQPILEIRNIGKEYKIGANNQPYLSLRDNISVLFSKKKKLASPPKFWALKNISFDVYSGESVAIIGNNGAGKSTLLKILSKITPPTKGQITARGRVASLLEVGTGFHPELSGRENIYLNGSILGLTRSEINQKFKEIVEFAEVQKFIETPLKHYSSGMQLRLAFSVAAHLEPEILVIDEVLAVGDVAFQQKCIGKMDDVNKSGRTIIFVSHNMWAVKKLCTKSIVLKNGEIQFKGTSNDGVDFYLQNLKEDRSKTGSISWKSNNFPTSNGMQLLEISLLNNAGVVSGIFNHSQKIKLRIKYNVLRLMKKIRVNLAIKTTDDIVVFSSSSESTEADTKEPGEYNCLATLPSHFFNEGTFVVCLQFGQPGIISLFPERDYLSFKINKLTGSGALDSSILAGITAPKVEWEIELTN